MRENERLLYIKIGFAAVFAFFILRIITKKRRDKEKDEAAKDEMITGTSKTNPFNAQAFVNEAYRLGQQVTRYTDGGKFMADKLGNMFGSINEDEAGILDFFRALKTQYQVAQISLYFDKFYGQTLSNLLANGNKFLGLNTFGGGLSNSDIAKITEIVKMKPLYRI